MAHSLWPLIIRFKFRSKVKVDGPQKEQAYTSRSMRNVDGQFQFKNRTLCPKSSIFGGPHYFKQQKSALIKHGPHLFQQEVSIFLNTKFAFWYRTTSWKKYSRTRYLEMVIGFNYSVLSCVCQWEVY